DPEVLQMTTLAINETTPAGDHVITGPELFEAPTVTVVDGMRIFPRRQSGHAPVGQATLFRLAGECFGQMHELRELRLHDGRLHGTSLHSIEIGALVTIGWEDPSMTACRGVVTMCVRGSDCWHATVELDQAMAA
ncbi:MAG: hypothetical protein VXX86_04720, partial [Planctomycetota bacterium]|nr:hypothetical protein [Planctomycetota bacterium]